MGVASSSNVQSTAGDHFADPELGKVKKDPLWKPILREFRQFFLTELSEALGTHLIRTTLSPLETETLETESRNFLTKLKAPDHLKEKKLNL